MDVSPKRLLFVMLLTGVVISVVGPVAVLAFEEPSSGTFAYDVYDIGIEKILKGPIGFVAGAGAMVFGATRLFTGAVFPAIISILGGAVFLKAPDLIETLGMLF